MVEKLIPSMSLTGNGLRDWLWQRISSVVLALYFVTVSLFFFIHPHLDFFILRHFFSTTIMQIFTLLALLSLFLHAWVGIWTVITDYINQPVIRFFIQVIVILSLAIYFFWGVVIILKLA